MFPRKPLQLKVGMFDQDSAFVLWSQCFLLFVVLTHSRKYSSKDFSFTICLIKHFLRNVLGYWNLIDALFIFITYCDFESPIRVIFKEIYYIHEPLLMLSLTCFFLADGTLSITC